MSSLRILFFTLALLCFLAANNGRAAEHSLDLPAALQHALRDNPELKAKRHSLGIAQGRAQQAGLLFQSNPRFSVEVESLTSGRSGTSVELNLHQEIEIAGQRGYRSEAAEKNLAQAQLSIEDAERLLAPGSNPGLLQSTCRATDYRGFNGSLSDAGNSVANRREAVCAGGHHHFRTQYPSPRPGPGAKRAGEQPARAGDDG